MISINPFCNICNIELLATAFYKKTNLITAIIFSGFLANRISCCAIINSQYYQSCNSFD